MSHTSWCADRFAPCVPWGQAVVGRPHQGLALSLGMPLRDAEVSRAAMEVLQPPRPLLVIAGTWLDRQP